MTARIRPHRKGLAAILAIAMLGLVSVALLAITGGIRYDLQRTRVTSEDAQLRQLLLAGAQKVAEEAKQWDADPKPRQWTMDLPKSLTEQGAAISFESGPFTGERRSVIVVARLGSRTEMQTIQLGHADGIWRVNSATLGQ